MEIPGIKGPSALPPERGSRVSRQKNAAGEHDNKKADTVSISSDSAKQSERINKYVNKLNQPDPEREQHLSEVRDRLESGELDRPWVFRQTAEKILRG